MTCAQSHGRRCRAGVKLMTAQKGDHACLLLPHMDYSGARIICACNFLTVTKNILSSHGGILTPFLSNGDFRPIASTEGLRRKAIRSAGVTLLGQGAAFFIQLGSTMVLARILTPSDFGVITMVTTFSLLLRSFGLNGFTELIMQREEMTHSLASNLFWIQLAIGTLLTFGFAKSGRLLSIFFHNGAVAPVAEVMSLTVGLGCLGWIHLGLLQRAMQFRTTAIISFVGQLLLAIVAIVLAVLGFRYWSIVWGSIAQVIATVVGVWLACRWVPSLPCRASGTASGVRFATNVYLRYAFGYSTRNTDNLLVGWRYGARSLGFYKKAYDLFVVAESQLMAPISAVAVSALSRVTHDRAQFQRFFLRAVSVLALLGMGIGAEIALVGSDLMRILLGPGWGEAGQIFSLFGPGIGVMMLYGTHGWIHLSIGRPDRWFRWSLLEFACTLTLFLITLHWGPSGIALAWTLSYFLLMFPSFWYAGQPIGLGIRPMLSAIWKFFAASAGAGLITRLLIQSMPNLAGLTGIRGAFIRVVFVSLIFFPLYSLGLIGLHGGSKSILEMLKPLRDILPKHADQPTTIAPKDTIA